MLTATEPTHSDAPPSSLVLTGADSSAQPHDTITEKNLMLDGLRGIAILLVLGHHIYADVGTNDNDSLIASTCLRFFKYGYCGVDLFFVLSGYLITLGLLNTRTQKNYYRNFYTKRALRVWPLYFGTLLIVACCIPNIYKTHPGIFGQLKDWPWLILFLSNIPMALRNDYVFGNLAHFWSLAIEEQFYALWPFAVKITGKWIIPSLVALTVIAFGVRLFMVGTNQGHVTAYANTLGRMDGLAIGAIIACLRLRLVNAHAKWLANVVFVCSSAITVFVLWCLPKWGIAYGEDLLSPTLFSISFAALLVICLQANHPAHWFLKNRTLRFIGTISFGLYVLHNIIRAPIIQIGPLFEHFPVREQAIAIYACIKYGIAFALAIISYRYFEKPILDLKRHLLR